MSHPSKQHERLCVGMYASIHECTRVGVVSPSICKYARAKVGRCVRMRAVLSACVYTCVFARVRVYVCMCVCMYMCMCVCMDVATYAWTDVWTDVCIDGRSDVSTVYVWMYRRFELMHVCMYACMDVWMYGCMDVSTYGCMRTCAIAHTPDQCLHGCVA